MLWGMSRIGTEERKQTRFSSRGRGCTGLVEVLMIFLALFLSGAAMKPSSCSCARAFRMVPLPAASALLSSRSPGMAFVNCPDRRRCFNLATVLDWAVSPGCVSMGESYFLVTSDGKRSCRLCFFRSAFFGSMEEYDVQERFRRRLTESGSLGSKTVSPAPVSFLILG